MDNEFDIPCQKVQIQIKYAPESALKQSKAPNDQVNKEVERPAFNNPMK